MPARPTPPTSTASARPTPVSPRQTTPAPRPAGRRSPRGRMLAVLRAKAST